MGIHTRTDRQWFPHFPHQINDDREVEFILHRKQIYQLTRTTPGGGRLLPFVHCWGRLHLVSSVNMQVQLDLIRTTRICHLEGYMLLDGHVRHYHVFWCTISILYMSRCIEWNNLA